MIRRLLVAVAVLGLTGSGVLAQGVIFKGSGDLGVVYHGDTKDSDGNVTMQSSFTWISNFDLGMSASGTTDGGLTFGAGAKVKAGNAGSEVGKSNAYIGGESWKISIGDLDAASVKGQGLGDVGFDGLGVEDVAVDLVETAGADVEVSFTLGTASLAITVDQEPGMAADGDTPATKQTTEWAAGVSFDIGSTSLGIGMDSEKLMQASIGADLGSFGGNLYFAQRKVSTTETSESSPMTQENKITGIGAEIIVSAGANTEINAIYAQGKQTDVNMSTDNGATITDGDSARVGTTGYEPLGKTDKGFGVGVKHELGGGATLKAGFAKVKKQTKASVGVSMSF